MYRNKYIPTISSLYINYIFQGIAAITISQNMSVLRHQWGASFKEISLVLSAIGLGRILSINCAGILSDRLGRQKSAALGIVSYILFFLGILYSPNYQLAFAFAIFAGFGNAFLDTAMYPVVVEAFESHEKNSALSVLNKAFISIGQFLFPIITRFILQNDYYFGWPFLIAALCMGVNLLVTFRLPFPESDQRESNSTELTGTISISKAYPVARFSVEGVALLIFSFVSVSLFNVFITWIPTYAQFALDMEEADSLVMVSAYSVFSLVSVFCTSYIVNRGIHIPYFMIFCTSTTGISLLLMLLMPNYYTVIFATFCVGFFAAGGIWQLGLVILLEFFPYRRGMITSYYSLATSISVMGIPYVTGLLAEMNINYVFILIVVLALLGTIALLFVVKHYQALLYSQS